MVTFHPLDYAMTHNINKVPYNKYVYGVFILITLLAAGTRFYKISEWPFAYDETGTLKEVDSVINTNKYPVTSQTYRLPRIIPIAYGLHYIGYKIFGINELGTRIFPAIASICNIIIIFIVVQSLYGLTASTITSLLLIFFPEYLFHAQQNRHYSVTALFSTITFLAGLYMVKNKSFYACVVACVSIVLGYFCNPIGIVFCGILFLVATYNLIIEKRNINIYILIIISITSLILLCIYILYTRKYLYNWNAGETWGYSVFHAILSSINQIGWQYFIILIVISVFIIKNRSVVDCYVFLYITLWISFPVILPFVFPFNPSYMLSLSICMLIIVGIYSGKYIESIMSERNIYYYIVITSICLLSLPSFISYYKDGSRYDYRKAANYIKNNWQYGDKVTAFAIGQFGYYASDLKPAFRLDLETKKAIQQLSYYYSPPGRLWVVAQSTRGGLNIELKKWLGNNCSIQFVHQKRRYDYHEYTVEVYLCK